MYHQILERKLTMKTLFVINGSAYGLDSTFNAIRLAGNLAKRDGIEVTVFLMGDGVTAAVSNQKTPDGYYKLDRMLSHIAKEGQQILCCGTCMDARGIQDSMLMEGAGRSTMDELAEKTIECEKVLVF
jgi:uncharacterized protein involved in oxidation of intracellular sulfur